MTVAPVNPEFCLCSIAPHLQQFWHECRTRFSCALTACQKFENPRHCTILLAQVIFVTLSTLINHKQRTELWYLKQAWYRCRTETSCALSGRQRLQSTNTRLPRLICGWCFAAVISDLKRKRRKSIALPALPCLRHASQIVLHICKKCVVGQH